MVLERPRKCPYGSSCTPLWQSFDEDQRLCGGVLQQSEWINHDGLIDSLCLCDDGEPMEVDLPDLVYEAQRAITLLLYGLSHNLPNACSEVGIADPVRKLTELLEGKIRQ